MNVQESLPSSQKKPLRGSSRASSSSADKHRQLKPTPNPFERQHFHPKPQYENSGGAASQSRPLIAQLIERLRQQNAVVKCKLQQQELRHKAELQALEQALSFERGKRSLRLDDNEMLAKQIRRALVQQVGRSNTQKAAFLDLNKLKIRVTDFTQQKR